jgi:membrane protein
MFSQIVAMLKDAAAGYKEDGAGRLGGALSYYTIFSLIPLMFLVLAIAGFVFQDPTVVDRLVKQVAEVAGSQVGKSFESMLTLARDQRGGTLSIGLILAAYSASGIFQQVQSVLGVVFDITPDQQRKGVVGLLIKRGVAFVSAVGFAVVAFAPIVAVGAVGWLVRLVPEGLSWLDPVLRLGVPIVSVLVLMAVVGLSFQVLTRARIPWAAAWRGGAATAIVGLITAFVVGAYLTRFGASGTLGALGGMAILLFFFGLMWTVYLFGAEVTEAYARRLSGEPRAQPIRTGAPQETAGAQSGGKPPTSGFFAFLVGLAIGWRSGRNK